MIGTRPMTGARPAVVAALLGLLLAVAGCQDGGGDGGGGAAAQPGPAGVGDRLPDLELPDLAGGAPVRLADLRGPAVVNLWASWCAPCRDELPMLQQYADQADGQVRVFGVVTEDQPERATALAADLGVRFPALDDPPGRLRSALGVPGLPATVLVDSAGRIRHLQLGPLAQPELSRLVAEHLGVRM